MQWVCEIALSDSQTAFKSLYLAYFQRLMRFTSLYVPSSVEAEEIVSDTFLSLWNNRKSLPEISNFDSYIYGIARHKAISLYRTQHMEKVQIDENTIDLFAHTDTTPEEELISKECIDHLNEAINTLPDLSLIHIYSLRYGHRLPDLFNRLYQGFHIFREDISDITDTECIRIRDLTRIDHEAFLL